MKNNVTSILDLNEDDVSQELYDLIQGQEDYRDLELKEHLYSCDLLDHLSTQGISTDLDVEKELEEIEKLCEDAECSYWRILSY